MGFLAGYVIGAGDGADALDEVIDAAKRSRPRRSSRTSSGRSRPRRSSAPRGRAADRSRFGRGDVDENDPRTGPGYRATWRYRDRILEVAGDIGQRPHRQRGGPDDEHPADHPEHEGASAVGPRFETGSAVGPRQHVLGGLGVLGDRHAERGVETDAWPPTMTGSSSVCWILRISGPSRLLVGDRHHDHELAPADPAHGVLGPQDRGEPARHLAQDRVPRGVPEVGVDLAQVVEVDVADDDLAPMAPPATSAWVRRSSSRSWFASPVWGSAMESCHSWSYLPVRVRPGPARRSRRN